MVEIGNGSEIEEISENTGYKPLFEKDFMRIKYSSSVTCAIAK